MDAHNGFLHKYGGFLVKRWRQRFVAVEEDGSLYIGRGPGACPRGPIALPSACRAVVPGPEVGTLPPLPTGARPECCLALQLLGGKHMFLLAGDTSEFSRWFSVLLRARKGTLGPLDGRIAPSPWSSELTTRDKQRCRVTTTTSSSSSTPSSSSPPNSASAALFHFVQASRHTRPLQLALPACSHRRHHRACVDLAFLMAVGTVAGPTLGLVGPGSAASIEGTALRECVLGVMGAGGGGGGGSGGGGGGGSGAAAAAGGCGGGEATLFHVGLDLAQLQALGGDAYGADFGDFEGFEGTDFGAFSF